MLLIPGQETKIPHAMRHGQKQTNKQTEKQQLFIDHQRELRIQDKLRCPKLERQTGRYRELHLPEQKPNVETSMETSSGVGKS